MASLHHGIWRGFASIRLRHTAAWALCMPMLGWAAGAETPVIGPAFGPSGNVANAAVAPVPSDRDVNQWLTRIHKAAREQNYMGTFVVLTASGGVSSSRIWHACDGAQQMERVESLTGTQRSTFRRNDEVTTFFRDQGVVRIERRESLDSFPHTLPASDAALHKFYAALQTPSERVAGYEADVVYIKPRDALRYGYRIWSEKRTGLALQMETLDTNGRMLEQVTFSDLRLDAPVHMDRISRMMNATAGYKIERADLPKTTASAEGWRLKSQVPGFQSINCYRRPLSNAAASAPTMQCIFSDGMASVSLFLEPLDTQRSTQSMQLTLGATRTLTQRVADTWWLTAVGEVPMQTLKLFANSLERVGQLAAKP